MELKVRHEEYNALLKRKEVRAEIEHDGAGTPSRVDLRKSIASKYGAKPESVYVINVETGTGTQSALCEAQVYDDPQSALRTVPKHIQIRNLPAEERKRVREQEAKKAEPKAKPEKPKVEKTKEEKPKGEAKQATESAPKKDGEAK
jgi:ribosomal protein S24E